MSERQKTAYTLLGKPQTHTLLYGGSGSGKTHLIIHAIVVRALKAAGSRHGVLRMRFNHVRQSIGEQIFPKVMKECFPGVKAALDSRDWFYTFPNGSELWLGGLDDKERTEKLLGHEYVTLYLNECSQITYTAQTVATTRLRQTIDQHIEGRPKQLLRPRMLYDCNPPNKGHWVYRMFMLREDPVSGTPLPYPHEYESFGPLNPMDNLPNLPDSYLRTLEGMPERQRKRFIEGLFAEANPNALWTEEMLERWRCTDYPDLQRVVVGVDPSGSGDEENADNDEIGIVVVALGTDGVGYVLEDCSLKAGPARWGAQVVAAFERQSADLVVGEVNYGGAMVEHVIRTAATESGRRLPFRAVTASRGKVVRAEPISALFESGKVRLAGQFRELEQELLAFATNGYTAEGSPNRADAMIWACHELFGGITRQINRGQQRPAYAVM